MICKKRALKDLSTIKYILSLKTLSFNMSFDNERRLKHLEQVNVCYSKHFSIKIKNVLKYS